MILVWDLFIRIFHWCLVVIVISNQWLNEEGDPIHQWLGYIACGLIGIRFFWGFYSKSPYARWSAFFPTPSRMWNYLKLFIKGKDPHMKTHNPLAASVMILMMLLILGLGITGFMTDMDRFFGEDWVVDLHTLLANSLIFLAAIHLCGIFFEIFRRKENIIASMIHGKKKSD